MNSHGKNKAISNKIKQVKTTSYEIRRDVPYPVRPRVQYGLRIIIQRFVVKSNTNYKKSYITPTAPPHTNSHQYTVLYQHLFATE